MLCVRQSSLVKPLEPSSWAACLDGPNTLMPAAVKASAMPATSGASGPITTKSIFSALGQRHLAGDVLGPDVDAFGHLGDAGIAGRAVQFCAQGGRGNRPTERMFAAAAAHHQDSHVRALTTVCAGHTSR